MLPRQPSRLEKKTNMGPQHGHAGYATHRVPPCRSAAYRAGRPHLFRRMGQAIDRETFTDEEFARFSARLQESLQALGQLLARPGFGVGPRTVGAELELHLVDPRMRPLRRNRTVLERMHDPRMVAEVDAFNIECNTAPGPLAGRPFAALATELRTALDEARRGAADAGGRIAMIGTLPTLLQSDLGPAALTALPRYRALARSLRARRNAPFHLHIDGIESLVVEEDDVTPLGASTSFQLHLRVDPRDFGRAWNAAEMATGPVLALCGNAPIFLGRKLWQETRIALFCQSTDDRTQEEQGRPPRVNFGAGWATRGAGELFERSVALHPPVLPVCSAESPLAVVEAGDVPHLDELRLHHGTVWTWNRAVYDAADGGHLRVEFRALPAGPTVVDMLANAAFALGLTLALEPQMDAWAAEVPFAWARSNFFAAARHGLDATFHWPGRDPVAAPALIAELLPRARAALVEAGVEPAEVKPLFDVLAARLHTGQTGARWQLATLAEREHLGDEREVALAEMLARYVERSETDAPVHTWPVG